MDLKQLVSKLGELRVCQKRVSSPVYEEWVIFAEDMGRWEHLCSELLGPATKPKGEKTSPLAFALTVDFGGINDDQVLYHKESGEMSVIALFWPWQNGVHVTLKLACFKKEDKGRKPEGSP